ncbi:MAG: chemotaxis protein CheW [Gemmatimonadaceae bacterium]|nr:chemotaxis protein CheW [Gemmatimonadaceae bacterium]
MARALLVVDAGGVLLGVDSVLVREIVPARSMTRLPGAPPCVRGLLNVRGTLVTVVDVAKRFGAGVVGLDERSVVILVADARTLGLLVDDVQEVRVFEDEDLLPAPSEDGEGLVRAMGHFDARVVLEVDVPELVRQTLA